MESILEKQTYFEVKNIVGIKTYLYDVHEYEVKEGVLQGTLSLNLTFYDSMMEEKFESFTVPFSIISDDDCKISEVEINTIELDLIDGQGINCNFSLKISFEREEKQIINQEIEINNNFSDEEPEKELDKNIEEIEDNYKQLLDDSMSNRKEENVEIITTKSRQTSDNFMSFFTNQKHEFYNIISLKVNDENELNKIANDHKVTLEDLLKGYDSESKTVVFRSK